MRIVKLIMVFFFFGVLCACSSSEGALTHYFKIVKSRPAKPIPPIPEFKPLSKFIFPADDKRRSPFEPKQATNQKDIFSPNTKRPKQPLEAFPLDTLKFVGILKAGTAIWALISQPGGLVTRVKVGDYMGKNYGKIINVNDNKIKLEETSKAAGRWEKKIITIDLRSPK